MKWISVKEELPDAGTLVFVAYKKTFPASCKIGKQYQLGTQWFTHTDTHIKTPDYWAPIVPLPKDEPKHVTIVNQHGKENTHIDYVETLNI